MKRMCKVIVQTFYFMMFVSPGSGGKLELLWDKNPDKDDISGYLISCHTDQSGFLPPPDEFEKEIDVPAGSPELTQDRSHVRYCLKGLAENRYYWIAVRVYRIGENLKQVDVHSLPGTNSPEDNSERFVQIVESSDQKDRSFISTLKMLKKPDVF